MKQLLAILFLVFPALLYSQQPLAKKESKFVLTPEIMAGQLADANENFPDHNTPFQLLLNFGWDHRYNAQEWAQRLKGPTTGLSLGISDFGNKESLGNAITLMPFIEFNALRMKRLKIKFGMGGSYFTEKYDPITNPNNQGITTDLVWSFQSFFHYQVLNGEKLDWRLGVGYFHHSNGHTRLLNQGLNLFMFSLSADIKTLDREFDDKAPLIVQYDTSKSNYISFNAGYGINVLSTAFNDKKPVYTVSGEVGKLWNKTYKVGIGFYYRLYQHYYDYIENNEFLVRSGEEFDYFKEDPWRYATNFGIHTSAEVLLNHIGIHIEIGLNLHKPGYQIDWRINEGWDNVPREIPPWYQLGEFDSKYKLKKTLATRMGMRYYLINTSKSPTNNLFIGFHINSNGGQADFTDVRIGYQYTLKRKKR
jgi:hypothetical protein